MDCPIAILPGAGSAGRAWDRVAGILGAVVIPVPDEPDVPAMAEAVLPAVADLGQPPVLVGASLGAMVALEVARRRPVKALVLAAAGFGVTVSEQVLDQVAAAAPDLATRFARASIADRNNREMVDFVAADFSQRGQQVMLRHLQALAAYRPDALANPPPTIVLWGELDRSVPLADHLELAKRLGGCLVPVQGVGHLPFYEAPEKTIHWIRVASSMP